MDTLLLIIGILVAMVLGSWMFSRMSAADAIDKEEEADVRAETPAEHERAKFDEVKKIAETEVENTELYSHESGDE